MQPSDTASLGLGVSVTLLCAAIGCGPQPGSFDPVSNPQANSDQLSRVEPLVVEREHFQQGLADPGGYRYEGRAYWHGRGRVEPCGPTSSAYRAAERELLALAESVRGASPDDSVVPLNQAYRALRQQRCFETLSDLPYEFSSIRSLSAFWNDGGRLAFENALDVGSSRSFVVAPTAIASTDTLSTNSPGLWQWWCADPRDCPQASSWKSELQANLDRERLQESLNQMQRDSSFAASEQRCEAAAKTAPERLQFELWRRCIERVPEVGEQLPLDNFRAADEGWLYLRHARSQERSLAVNLSTGTAVEESSGLRCETEPGRQRVCSFGPAARGVQTEVTEARRMLWLGLMAATGTRRGARDARLFEIPEFIEPVTTHKLGYGSCGGGCACSERFTWAFVAADGTPVAGEQLPCCARGLARHLGQQLATWLDQIEPRPDAAPPKLPASFSEVLAAADDE